MTGTESNLIGEALIEGRSLCLIGADHVIDYTQEDLTENGQRYDLILDIAAQRSILHSAGKLCPGGALGGWVLPSVAGWSVDLGARMGIFQWQPDKREDLEFLKDLLETGRITPLIDRRNELSGIPQALR